MESVGRAARVCAAVSGAVLGVVGVGCAVPSPIGDGPEVIHARFDPQAGVIPMPSDLLRDAEANHLALPADDPDATPAERELYEFLNSRDAWSVASSARVELTGAVIPATANAQSVIVLERLADGALVKHDAPRIRVSEDERTISVDPPLDGWSRGSTVVLALRGGAAGLAGRNGERVECDAAFYFLRLTTPLTDPEHERAFPGETAEERRAAAEKLEKVRLSLAPWFDELALQGIPREEVAALWTFTTTSHTELTMSKAMRKMPLPIDLLIDPADGTVDLPLYDEDGDLEREAKKALSELDGFGPTMTPQFEFTAAVDPVTVTADSVQLWRIGSPPEAIAGTPVLSDDGRRVTFTAERPLLPETRYVLAVRDSLRDAEGNAIAPMSPGHLMKAKNPLLVDGVSTIGAVPLDEAERLEPARSSQSAFLDAIGRGDLLAAWPFKTMSILHPLLEAQRAAETSAVPVDPYDVESMSPFDAGLSFPIGALTLWRVQRVFEGTITTPDFLDPATRGRYPDGHYENRQVNFTLTIPDSAEPGVPVPVVVFGHGLMTERRFVLAIADALAAKGFAAISIDFPYHGTRSVCAWNGPICFPNPMSTTGEMICPDPCNDGSTCSEDGMCRDEAGAVTPLREWPIVPMYQATGAAFIDVESLVDTRDHFRQAVVDLGALSRSIRLGDWETATGFQLDGSRLHYMGQSLGGILGGLYAPLDPAMERVVLNVPGGNMVTMFTESALFSLHIEAFFERHEIVPGSPDHGRFLNIAHWVVDGVDPINVARNLVDEPIPGAPMPAGRDAIIQMATLDFIIPNVATGMLAEEAGVPKVDYLAEHGFITIPIEPAYLPGVSDAAGFLDGSWQP